MPSRQENSTAHQDHASTSTSELSHKSSVYISLAPAAPYATSSPVVSHLARCVVDLSPSTSAADGGAPFATLYLRNIKDSLIICGHVSGAVHITHVSNSVVVMACRQFRMHASRNVDIYLHSASRPIFEDCEGLRFAPLPECYVCCANKPKPELCVQLTISRSHQTLRSRRISGIRLTTSSGSRLSPVRISPSSRRMSASLTKSGETWCLEQTAPPLKILSRLSMCSDKAWCPQHDTQPQRDR